MKGYRYILGIALAGLLLNATTLPANEVELQWDTLAVAQSYADTAGMRATLHEGDSFQVIHIGQSNWAQQLTSVLNRIERHFYRTFADHGFSLQPPQEPLRWLCFDRRADYDYYTWNADMLRLDQLDGYYSEWTNRVAIVHAPRRRAASREADAPQASDVHEHSPETQTHNRIAMHEAVHQLSYNSGLLRRGVVYPLWVTEGMATALEAPRSLEKALADSNQARRQRLLAAWRADKLQPLDAFMTSTAPPRGLASARVAYAQAWGVYCMLMSEEPAALKRYLSDLYRADPGARGQQQMREEIANAFGDAEAMQARWEAYVQSLADARK